MAVTIAGGHGKIAIRLTRVLSERGDEVRSLIRNPDHAEDVRDAGAEPVVCDLEQAGIADVASAIGAVDAVVFAAGAGPGSGAERKETLDYGGAVKLAAAAKQGGVERYLMISSKGADPQAQGDDTFAVYLRAKGRADEILRQSDLAYTIVRPVRLTDDPGTGHVEVGEHVEGEEVPRDDVAAALAASLGAEPTIRTTFELASGETPIDQALGSL